MGVVLRVTVVVAEEIVAVENPRHSVILIVQEAGVNVVRAAASHVIPVVATLETVTVLGFVMTKRINSSAAVVVVSPVIVNVVPELQVPVFLALAFASTAGTAPIAILVSTVEVEADPEVVDNPLHSVPQVPTVVAFVKSV